MLEKSTKVIPIIGVNIIILMMLYVGMIAINFFTEEEVVTKQTIVGINPVKKTSMFYQEPLTVLLETEKIPVLKESIETNKKEEKAYMKEQAGEENSDEIIADNVLESTEIRKSVEEKESIPTRV